MRLFTSRHIATTKGFFANVRNGNKDILTSWQIANEDGIGNLDFVQPVALKEIDTNAEALMATRAAYSMFFATWFDSGEAQQYPALCANMTEEAMQTLCAGSRSVKLNIVNHLLAGSGRTGFQLCTVLWGCSVLLHDWLVLVGSRQSWSLCCGFVSLILKGTAAATVLFWAFGATQAFTSPLKDQGACACYYQMPGVQALLLLSSPFLLMPGVLDQLGLWVRTVIYGDLAHLHACCVCGCLFLWGLSVMVGSFLAAAPAPAP
ncbi:unnamed protein product [Effrenium voratum]|nr:unnamed protein product [Effrenium voratum]